MNSEINLSSNFRVSEKVKISIILSLVGFFASQKLYFKSLYQINFPFGMDFSNGVNYVFTYVKTGVFPFGEFFAPISGHIHVFPRLIALPNILFNSFDVANLFYLHWGLESIALFLIFLLLRRTDPKLYWILIPISAFIYSPLQDSNYWSFAIMLWLLPPVAIMGMIYLLNKGSNLKFLSPAIGLAIVSTFSVTIGIVAWLVGIFALIKFDPHRKKWIKKKFLSIWVASTVIIGLIFYSQFSINETQPNLAFLFTFDGFAFLATFISSAFRLKYHFLMVLVGSASLILGSYCVYYFAIKKNNLKIALPWILFLIVGVGGGIALDASKYVALKKQIPLILVPTIVSSGAIIHGMFAKWSGNKIVGGTKDMPWVDADHVLVDYGVVHKAPYYLNTSGLGDVLCGYASLSEWRYKSKNGIGPAYDPDETKLVNAMEILHDLHSSEIFDKKINNIIITDIKIILTSNKTEIIFSNFNINKQLEKFYGFLKSELGRSFVELDYINLSFRNQIIIKNRQSSLL